MEKREKKMSSCKLQPCPDGVLTKWHRESLMKFDDMQRIWFFLNKIFIETIRKECAFISGIILI